MKKNYLLYTACALAIASLNSCEDFLNKDPQDKQTNDTYWQTETSLRTYAQDFYSSYFKGYGKMDGLADANCHSASTEGICSG